LKFQLNYLKIDDSLPDLKYEEENSGIDLYVRENVLIPPSLGLIQLGGQQNGIILPDKNMNQRNIVTVGQVKPASSVPLNIVLKGDYRVSYLLVSRSSLHKRSLYLANSVGVIDPSYEGENDEIRAMILNFSPIPVYIRKGERICQLLFLGRAQINDLVKVKEHWGSRSRGGFGSTGI